MRGSEYVLPMDKAVVSLLGGVSQDGVTLTHDQHKSLMLAYGYDETKLEADIEETRDKHTKAVAQHAEKCKDLPEWKRGAPPAAFNEAGLRNILEAGASRNIMRAVQNDGLRVMGLIASYLEADEDPVDFVARLMVEARFDVPDWSEPEDPSVKE